MKCAPPGMRVGNTIGVYVDPHTLLETRTPSYLDYVKELRVKT